MKIQIESDLEFSEYKFDLAYGRAKRFLNSRKESCVYPFNDFAVTIKKVNGDVFVKVKSRSE